MATGHFDYINSKRIPYPNREYVESFDLLMGGVNTFDQPFNLKANEAALMKNMTWREGSLGSRRGQVDLAHEDENHDWFYLLPKVTAANKAIKYVAMSQFLYKGWAFIQASVNGTYVYPDDTSYPMQIYAVKMRLEGFTDESPLGTVKQVFASNTACPNPGIFFEYRESVYFKGIGFYEYFYWNPSTTSGGVLIREYPHHFTLHVYTPVLQTNTNPTSGAGNFFQQENRLNPRKRIIYTAQADVYDYHLPESFAPLSGAYRSVVWVFPGSYAYTDLSAIPGSAFIEATIDPSTGTVTLDTAQTEGASICIDFYSENPDAYDSLMDCNAAIVFGGAQELCVVFGAPDSQPNAYFWSGNDGTVMNPTYFPMNQYNLAGDNDERITCFGKQQNMLVIFQSNATGRAVFGTETIMGYVQVTMNYTRINDKIGCDLPFTLQLIENNLVWANTKFGVCRLKDSSAAYENNITVISRKIHNRYDDPSATTPEFTGLFSHFKLLGNPNRAKSADTGRQYLLLLGTWIYEWNYEISTYDNPSWFIHTDISAAGFLSIENDVLYEVTPDGVIAEYKPVFYDQVRYADGALQTESIRKVYIFPPRNFGTYDRLKNIMSAIFTTRADTDQQTAVRYICDYAERRDPTDLVVTASHNRFDRPYASVFRRKPGYHNIRHLQIRLFNNEVGKDLSIISAQIFYTLRGRQR